jgi:hypothetical protein
MLGQNVAYDRVPYFYTDQYDLGMEHSGYVEPDRYDQVVFRGNVAEREFLAFWLAGGRVLAGMNVNVWDVTDPIQALVRSGRPVEASRLADPQVCSKRSSTTDRRGQPRHPRYRADRTVQPAGPSAGRRWPVGKSEATGALLKSPDAAVIEDKPPWTTSWPSVSAGSGFTHAFVIPGDGATAQHHTGLGRVSTGQQHRVQLHGACGGGDRGDVQDRRRRDHVQCSVNWWSGRAASADAHLVGRARILRTCCQRRPKTDPLSTAASSGDRNNRGERLRWCLPSKGLSRAVVEGLGDGV